MIHDHPQYIPDHVELRLITLIENSVRVTGGFGQPLYTIDVIFWHKKTRVRWFRLCSRKTRRLLHSLGKVYIKVQYYL